jgi:hypothetical protein
MTQIMPGRAWLGSKRENPWKFSREITMKTVSRARVAIAAALMAAVSLTTIGVTAVAADASQAHAVKRVGDNWPY